MVLENARRLDRERVLSLLYEVEMKGAVARDVLDELPVMPDPFVVETVVGVASEISQLDDLLARHAKGWDVERMAAVDRNILRIGTWELLNRSELSVAIVITEALELAKRFSGDDAGRFVNGILSAIARSTGRGDATHSSTG